MRRIRGWMRWRGTQRFQRQRLWVALCIVAGALAMSSALSGSARPVRATRRPGKQPVVETRELGQNARHQGNQAALAPTLVDGFITRTYTDPSGATMVYYLYIPPDALVAPQTGASKGYPVVLLLHGVGERGEPAESVAQNRNRLITNPYVRLWSSPTVQKQWPSIIIVPQVASPNRWVDTPPKQGVYTLAPTPATSLTLAHEILQVTLAQYASVVDTNRVYVTGISMGAFGVWDAIERWPQDFAAAAPVSGAGDPSQVSAIATMPIWDFHGALDTTVPPIASRDMIAAITAAGGHPLYTEIPGAHHDIWVRVYSDHTFLAWLFAQHRAA